MRYFVSILVLAMLALGFAQEANEVYTTNCVACHQASGEGLPGAFPNLKGNVSVIAGLEGGREYLIRAVLFGNMGEIKVGENVFNGAMPAWASLSDEDIALIENMAESLQTKEEKAFKPLYLALDEKWEYGVLKCVVAGM